MIRIDGYHLPALEASEITPSRDPSWSSSDVEVFGPSLSSGSFARQLRSLRDEQVTSLSHRPVDEIMEVIDRVARRFQDDADPLRERALAGIGAVTGLSGPMCRLVLDGMASDWRAGPILTALAADFPDPRVLDGFVEEVRTGRRLRALPPPLIVHIFSGNVPGVSVTSLIRALLVKSASLGKTARGEPVLAPLFARAVAEADPALGRTIAVLYWPHGDALEQAALKEADAVIAYGGGDAIDSLRAMTPPATPFHAYGHRVSFGALSRESMATGSAARLADAAAVAVATFDQQGCVSPHLFYVEEGGETTPAAWAARLADAIERTEAYLPRGRIGSTEAATIQQVRARAEIGQLSGQGHRLHTPASGTQWTVIFDPSPAFTPSCLNRLVRVKPVASLDAIPGLVAPIARVLQTAGLEAPPHRAQPLAESLARLGITRIAPIEKMAWPPPSWRHDGRPPIASLVRWCDWE